MLHQHILALNKAKTQTYFFLVKLFNLFFLFFFFFFVEKKEKRSCKKDHEKERAL